LLKSFDDLPVQIHVGKTPEVIETADACLVVSGSVSLELLARATPAVILYRSNLATCVFCNIFLHINFITLPNLMVNRAILPEFPSIGNPENEIRKMAAQLTEWMNDEDSRQVCLTELQALKDDVVKTGASGRAANIICERLGHQTSRQEAA